MSTRSKTFSGDDAAFSSQRTVGYLQKDTEKGSVQDSSPSCTGNISDGMAPLKAASRCDDGSNKIIASSELAERAIIKGIQKVETISAVHFEIDLTKQDK